MHMKFVFPYLYNPASYILIIATKVYEFNLFWDCAKAFVKIFNIHNDFNATYNFIRFFKFTYRFVEVNTDVSYDES